MVKLEIFDKDDKLKAFIYQRLSKDPSNFLGTIPKLFINANCKTAGLPKMLQS